MENKVQCLTKRWMQSPMLSGSKHSNTQNIIDLHTQQSEPH